MNADIPECAENTGKDAIQVLTNIKNRLAPECDDLSARATRINDVIEYINGEIEIYKTAFVAKSK